MTKDVSLQGLRQAIGEGIAGDYSCSYDPATDIDSFSWQARELEAFAAGKGYRARSHPSTTGGANTVDLIVVRI